MPRNFAPDDTLLVSVELSAKDWLVISETLSAVARKAQAEDLRQGLGLCVMEISEQSTKALRIAAQRLT